MEISSNLPNISLIIVTLDPGAILLKQVKMYLTVQRYKIILSSHIIKQTLVSYHTLIAHYALVYHSQGVGCYAHPYDPIQLSKLSWCKFSLPSKLLHPAKQSIVLPSKV